MLTLESVSKRWREFAHRDVSLSVAAGELFVLLGPSGAGKTLLLELISGFQRVDSGRIIVAGRDVTDLPPEKRNVGLVWQELLLFPRMTARENIEYGARAKGKPVAERRRKVETLSEMLHVDTLLDRPVEKLSVGQKQRVALARALAVEPDVLLLDEPFSSLDVPLKTRLWAELRDLHSRTGVTTLLVTHDRTEALALGERIGVMRDGRIVQVGAADVVLEKPASRFVAEFTGATNIYSGMSVADGSLTAFSDGSITLISTEKRSGICHAVVRPESIIVSRDRITTSARNQLEGTVEQVRRKGDLYEVMGRFGMAKMTCVVTPQSVEELGLAPGARVCFSFKAGSVHLVDAD